MLRVRQLLRQRGEVVHEAGSPLARHAYGSLLFRRSRKGRVGEGCFGCPREAPPPQPSPVLAHKGGGFYMPCARQLLQQHGEVVHEAGFPLVRHAYSSLPFRRSRKGRVGEGGFGCPREAPPPQPSPVLAHKGGGFYMLRVRQLLRQRGEVVHEAGFPLVRHAYGSLLFRRSRKGRVGVGCFGYPREAQPLPSPPLCLRTREGASTCRARAPAPAAAWRSQPRSRPCRTAPNRGAPRPAAGAGHPALPGRCRAGSRWR